ncbi:expressed unknown protein [Seminavis robusta]|uniref:Uncharacterized protein n=1 Tax=Seminavis robusta TaxID=568900 RepID=A0A9N8EF09_9STRA|nr:expressed unknown protein [Seminavis robusta]|eukprot:Sro841_g209620.1 n/a (268) ;mRNA; f:35890-36693
MTETQRDQDKQGKLYGTIEDVWGTGAGTDTEPFEGFYQGAVQGRSDRAPESYNVAWRISTQSTVAPAPADVNALQEYEDVLTVISDTGGTAEGIEVTELERVDPNAMKSTVQELTKPEVEANKDIRSLAGGLNKSRGHHLIPDDPGCRRHWEPMLDVVSGRQFDQSSTDQRMKMAKIISELTFNKVILNGIHQHFFDTLSSGNLLVVPLLKQSDIVGWDHKQTYRVLVVCDSPRTYELFAATTEDASAYWAAEEDLELEHQDSCRFT